jgi:hypothetical protein
MKVTGFSFVQKAIGFNYSIIEAINSILPICDDFIVAVGQSDNATMELIKTIDSPKIKIIETAWEDSVHEGGKVLAVEIDKAFQSIPADSDWAFYIQGDEIIHKKYRDTIYNEMLRWKNNQKVDGLLFKYKHSLNTYNHIDLSTRWCRNEIRVIKNNKDIHFYHNAQSFRKGNNQRLNVKSIDAYVYHYDSSKHSYVLKPKIKMKNWKFDYDLSPDKLSIIRQLKIFMDNNFWLNTPRKNYKIV